MYRNLKLTNQKKKKRTDERTDIRQSYLFEYATIPDSVFLVTIYYD